jgi:hypothetical protein
MISPAEWERMSWHAREKYLKRLRREAANLDSTPAHVEESVQKTVRVRVRSSFKDAAKDMTRCNQCGAWKIDECATDHGARYEP